MEKLAVLVGYLQYILFPFCFFVIVYVVYSFYRTLMKGFPIKMVRPSIVKNGLGHLYGPGRGFAAAVASGEISKDNHINFALVLDTNKMVDDYSRFIGSSLNVREIGEVFGGGENTPNDAI